jgi:small subunit ribosomal protein S16
MIKIRLQRHGARHAPFYRMVVTPATTRRDGKFIEVLGTYNPQAHTRTEELNLKMERIDHWLGVGAQPTDTAKSLIRQGRLTPEQWLAKSELQAAKRLARAQKGKSVPEVEVKTEEAVVPKEDVPAEPKSKAEEKTDKVESPKEEAAVAESKPEEKAPEAKVKPEEPKAPKDEETTDADSTENGSKPEEKKTEPKDEVKASKKEVPAKTVDKAEEKAPKADTDKKEDSKES